MKNKFRLVSEDNKISELELQVPDNTKAVLQYLGFEDANKKDVYQGDVLCLEITDDLLDHDKNMFFNSNIGKVVEGDRTISHVICVLDAEKARLETGYSLYFYRSGVSEVVTYGSDVNFPMYLVSKGALVIGHTLSVDEYIESLDNAKLKRLLYFSSREGIVDFFNRIREKPIGFDLPFGKSDEELALRIYGNCCKESLDKLREEKRKRGLL